MPVYPDYSGGTFTPDFPYKLEPNITPRWTLPGWYFPQVTTVAHPTGRMEYLPFFVEETTTYIRIAVEVTAGVAGSGRLGIYNWNNGVPGSLVLDAGVVDVTVAAVKQIVIAQALDRGYYFAAFVTDVQPTCTSITRVGSVPPLAGIMTGFFAIAHIALFVAAQQGQVAAGLNDPAVAPTNATYCDSVPLIIFRDN